MTSSLSSSQTRKSNPGNTAAPETSKQRVMCCAPSGLAQPDPSKPCTVCQDGWYMSYETPSGLYKLHNEHCTECQKGHSCKGGTMAHCAAGTRGSAGSDSAPRAPPGHTPAARDQIPAPRAPPGHTPAAGLASCPPCAARTYADSAGLRTCPPCTPGTTAQKAAP